MKNKTHSRTSFIGTHKWFLLRVMLVLVCIFFLSLEQHYRVGLGEKRNGTVTISKLKKGRGLGENAFEIELRGLGSTPDFSFEEARLIFPLYTILRKHYSKGVISIVWVESICSQEPMLIEVEGEDPEIGYSHSSGIPAGFLFLVLFVCGLWVVIDLVRMRRGEFGKRDR